MRFSTLTLYFISKREKNALKMYSVYGYMFRVKNDNIDIIQVMVRNYVQAL